MSEIDGNDVAAAGAQQSNAAADHQKRLVELNLAAQKVIGVTIRGMLVSAPGLQPIEIVCTTAFQFGQLLGQVFEGDLVTLLGLRKQMKDAFEKGMNSVTPQQAKPPPADLVKRLNGG